MNVREEILSGEVQGALLTPEQSNGLGVIVLGGSSGRTDIARAGLFASRGAIALALRWFGGKGQSPVIAEIPLERFIAASEKLLNLGCERIAFVGTSRGAEAALLVAVEDPRVEIVVAISPSAVAWAGDVWPPRSSWTRSGVPLPLFTTMLKIRPHEATNRFHIFPISRPASRGSPPNFPPHRFRLRRLTPEWFWSRVMTTPCGLQALSHERSPIG